MLRLRSSAFPHEAEIPARFTCDGADVSPPLAWSGVPEGTRSLALVVDDPDAPSSTPWVHWVVCDIPPEATELEEGASDVAIPLGAREGTNGWGDHGWRGPAPPKGRHRYVFTLYALDKKLPAPRTPSKDDVEAAMRGHVLDRAILVGTYQRVHKA